MHVGKIWGGKLFGFSSARFPSSAPKLMANSDRKIIIKT